MKICPECGEYGVRFIRARNISSGFGQNRMKVAQEKNVYSCDECGYEKFATTTEQVTSGN